MTRIYTIGYSKKDAQTFFGILINHKVKQVLDIRLNNTSQLSGFAKRTDLGYFLKEIASIKYTHDTRFAPTKELRNEYRHNGKDWSQYERTFGTILAARNLLNIVQEEYIESLNGICLLCSEAEPSKCHRRLVAEYIQQNLNDIEIIHL